MSARSDVEAFLHHRLDSVFGNDVADLPRHDLRTVDLVRVVFYRGRTAPATCWRPG